MRETLKAIAFILGPSAAVSSFFALNELKRINRQRIEDIAEIRRICEKLDRSNIGNHGY